VLVSFHRLIGLFEYCICCLIVLISIQDAEKRIIDLQWVFKKVPHIHKYGRFECL